MIKSDKWIRRQCEQPIGQVHIKVIGNNGLDQTFVEDVYSKESYNNFISEPHKEAVVQKLIERDVIAYRSQIISCEFQRAFQSDKFKPMIEPFVPHQVKTRYGDMVARIAMGEVPVGSDFDGDPEWNEKRIISYGSSSFGYDVRLDRKFKIFSNLKSALIDPLNMQDDCYVDHEGDFCIIPPNSYILGHTPETFNIPRNVSVICVGKSTYARAGAIVNVTPIEAGFQGQVVIEISNSTPLPLKVYAGMGISQFIFFESDEECEVSYADRKGKYQGQSGIQTALV
jgi:dCTP deaminase